MILPRLENFISPSPPLTFWGEDTVTGITYLFYIYIIYHIFFELGWFYFRNAMEAQKHEIWIKEYDLPSRAFTVSKRGLKIAFVLLQSKKNFITLYSDGNLPYFISFQEYLKVNGTGYLGHTTVFPQYLFWRTVYKLILQTRRIHYNYIPCPGKSHWQVLNTTPPPPNREKSLFAPRHWFSVNLFP